MIKKPLLLLVFISFLANTGLFAQAPTNDVCATAIPLALNAGFIASTNVGTVTNETNPSCGGTTAIKDVWYSFVFTGGTVTIQTSLGTLTDTRIAVYASCGGTQLACNDDFGGTYASQLVLSCSSTPALTVGLTYYIQAGGFQAQTGTFNIKVDSAGAGGCMNPQATNYNACATSDNGSCTFPPLVANFYNGSAGANCLMIQFTDVSEGNVNAWEWSFPGGLPSTSTAQNPIVTYPNAGIFSATLIAHDAFGGQQSITKNVIVETDNILTIDITPDLNPQQTSWKLFDINNYVVAQGTSNDATICISNNCYRFEIYDSAGNGLCCSTGTGSYALYLNGLQIASGSTFSSVDIRDVNCPNGTSCANPIIASLGTLDVPEPNTWYSFTPAENGQYRISTCGLASCDTRIWVYDYCNMANFNETVEATYTFNDDFCGVQSEVTPYLEAGITYYVRVGDSGAACGLSAFQVLFEYMGPIVGCMDVLACNYNPLAASPSNCYYNGDPNCSNLGPDLAVDSNRLFTSMFVTTLSGTDACLVNEGCLQGLGTRQIVRFSTKIANIGNQDYFIGVPSASNPQFVFDGCHNHYHYQGYAEYLLFDDLGNPMPEIGFKNGFCVLDLGCTTGIAKFGCGNMGITFGCYDEYSSGLSCQWIDITDVPAGSYHLVVRTNWDQDPDANGRYELRYDNNWAQVCITFGRDANGNIINFTKENVVCPVIVDCVGQPFGNHAPDCLGNCPGIVKRGDLSGDNIYGAEDVSQYMEGTLYGNVPVSECTDLNQDGEITIADAANLDACIHTQQDLGILPALMTECGWDDPVFDAGETVTIGIANLNTTNQYFDITVTNPNGSVNGMEFDLSGATIDHVVNLLSPTTWDVHIHEEELGYRISVIGHLGTMIPISTGAVSVMRVYYNSLEGNTICVSNIVEVLNVFLQNVIGVIGDCQSIATIDATFSASVNAICTGDQVQYSDTSTGSPTQWSWSMPGATPSSSSIQNPIVTYATPGQYSVTLTASNALTSDTYTATNIISVSALVTRYLDADGDGYGNTLVTIQDCNPVSGYVDVAGDCNDNNDAVNPSAVELCNGLDDNCNGQVDEGFDVDGDGFSTCQGDCDDNSAIIHPEALELCNSVDDDCDGLVDEGFDLDGDGYKLCDGDCNDNNGSVHPSAIEVCNGIDDNCNGQIDEGFDLDGDGFTVCQGDCNDNNSAIHPSATEVCNGVDDNCNGQVDEGLSTSDWYADTDGDGFGAGSPLATCNPPLGYVSNNSDCNDGNNAIHPDAAELCNGTDDNCNGQVDEGFDTDSDGFTTCQGDCNDNNSAIHPGAAEVCNGIDDNCNGQMDEGLSTLAYYLDFDGDGYGSGAPVNACAQPTGYVLINGDCNDNNVNVYPNGSEACGNLIDDNCNGQVDENCGGPAPTNNDIVNAQNLPVANLGSCNAVAGTLDGATPSSELGSNVVTGEDVWYSFVATKPGVRIVVTTAACNVLIELQDAFGSVLQAENINSSPGTEILNFGGLTIGATYYIAVANSNSTQGTGSFSICVQALNGSSCDYGVGPYTLCNVYKAAWMGQGVSYRFDFTQTTAPFQTFTRTQNSDLLVLFNVPGLAYNFTYNVSITAIYTLTNGSGQTETIEVPSASPCQMIVGPQPLSALRPSDRCVNGPKYRGAYVYSLPWVCGATGWEWEFTQIDPNTQVSMGLPFNKVVNTSSYTLNLGTVAQLQYGGHYMVRSRPLFLGGAGVYGASFEMCIVGSSTYPLAPSEGYSLEERNGEFDSEDFNQVDIAIYPNPNNGQTMNLNITGVKVGPVKVKIIDAVGRTVWRNQLACDGTLNALISFDTPLAEGMYTIELLIDGKRDVRKLLIER